MTVKSTFEFRFEEDAIDEGLRLTQAIGADMRPLDGDLEHEVLQDVVDPGHVMVNTHWASRNQAQAVLNHYKEDAKIKRAEELVPGKPKGFLAQVLQL